MEHILQFVRNLLQRHGYEIDESTLEVLSDTSNWEWVVYAREVASDTQVVLLGTDEVFTSIRRSSLAALSAWSSRQKGEA